MMPAQQAQQYYVVLFWILIFAVFYFLMIRPQRIQQRKRREMLQGLRRGDRVVTIGGLHATIADIKDDILTLDLAPNLRVKADRGAVSYVRSKGEE
ncbi:MAG: preprotein translocase subunit YajC [Armatimonadota bacterium]|nr:preprotein translocase subunit YajC [Armatimonadota bacterium]MDR7518051.1 preprotein translocase subunit YajC [Armatimonadota bacterium]MDR7550470.1 preprotein translocase subunit YajC [Armatimonadota bacterium]